MLDGQIPNGHPRRRPPGGGVPGAGGWRVPLPITSCCQNLFEGSDDATELLLPDDLLTDGSSRRASARSIHDADCDRRGEYWAGCISFYIAEKNKRGDGPQEGVPTETSPPSPSLFTRLDRALRWWENLWGGCGC